MITHDRRSIAVPLGKTRGSEHIREVVEHLEEKGYEVEVLKQARAAVDCAGCSYGG